MVHLIDETVDPTTVVMCATGCVTVVVALLALAGPNAMTLARTASGIFEMRSCMGRAGARSPCCDRVPILEPSIG